MRPRALALALGAAAMAASLAGCGGSGSYEVSAVFDDVGDLVRNHSVQVADVRVGRVTGIELTDDFKARVRMRINERNRVPRDSVAVVRQTSLLGEKFIELRPEDVDHPGRGPFLEDGDTLSRTTEAPELEFVAQQAIEVLGAVTASDVATLVDTGAEGFGGRGEELRSLVGDLATISRTLAERSGDIGRIVDSLDRATTTLAGASGDVTELLSQLAGATGVLAENRQRAVVALEQLGRLAGVQNEVLGRYRADIDRQLKQVDAIVGVTANATAEVESFLYWTMRFIDGLPRAIPEDFTQIYAWVVPQGLDPRTNGTGGGR